MLAQQVMSTRVRINAQAEQKRIKSTVVVQWTLIAVAVTKVVHGEQLSVLQFDTTYSSLDSNQSCHRRVYSIS